MCIRDRSLSDIRIVVPVVDMQTGGKIPHKDLHKVDKYLRECSERGQSKALLALSFPTDDEKVLQANLRDKKKKRNP